MLSRTIRTMLSASCGSSFFSGCLERQAENLPPPGVTVQAEYKAGKLNARDWSGTHISHAGNAPVDGDAPISHHAV